MRKNVTVKEAQEMAENVKDLQDLEKLILHEAYAIADGSQPSVQLLMAYARQHKKRMENRTSLGKEDFSPSPEKTRKKRKKRVEEESEKED